MAFELKIKPKEFDEVVWQDETDFTQEDYQNWLESSTQTLQDIYDDYEGEHDVYILGDIINLLSNIQIKGGRKGKVVYNYIFLVKIPNSSGWKDEGYFDTLEELFAYAKEKYNLKSNEIINSTERENDDVPYMWQKNRIGLF